MFNLFFKALLPLVLIIPFMVLTGCGKDNDIKAPGSVSGIVTIKWSGEMLNGAQIILNGGYSTVAEASGNFEFDRLLPGRYVLQCFMNGYITGNFPIDVFEGVKTACEIKMVNGMDEISVNSTIFDFGLTSSIRTLTIRNNSLLSQPLAVEIGKVAPASWLDISLNTFYLNKGESKVIELKADRTKLNKNETGIISVKGLDKTIFIVAKIIK